MIQTLLYFDPPYYKAENYEVHFSPWEHLLLQEVFFELKEAFGVISYNDVSFARELYPGCWQYTTTRPNSMRNHAGGGEYGELIITNYDPEKYANFS